MSRACVLYVSFSLSCITSGAWTVLSKLSHFQGSIPNHSLTPFKCRMRKQGQEYEMIKDQKRPAKTVKPKSCVKLNSSEILDEKDNDEEKKKWKLAKQFSNPLFLSHILPLLRSRLPSMQSLTALTEPPETGAWFSSTWLKEYRHLATWKS